MIRRAPAFGTKQAPINTHGKLGVSVHATHLATKARAVAALVNVAPVGPDAASHVIAGGQ
ncbi:hypothetical protein AC579_2991 [Pseudocercospora musae]|uniref:Uncharacterized protein n=1 Tax=Pseudocercospora musae TaxID=113226 RepID=A0A139I173_9PEZI|nr:hypothetical protein AC579_2991 [Pseudocercospora musae]